MTSSVPPARRGRPWLRGLWKVIVSGLATVGLFVLLWQPMAPALRNWFFVTEVRGTYPSPDRRAEARIEVTSGGLGTVLTTRVVMTAEGGESWTIYETGDSDFRPSVAWVNRDTLLLGLGCGVFGHISNPDDWPRADPRARRLKVRLTYVERCT